MAPSADAACETVVPGAAAPGAVSGLPATGADLSSLPWLVILAALIVLVGVLVVAGARRGRSAGSLSALVMLAVVMGVAAAAVPASSSQAAVRSGTASSCSLITVSDIQRGDEQETNTLLPGESADVLTFRVTNVFDASIELRASLAPTDGDASVFAADITVDSVVAATGNLSLSPETSPISLAAGQHVDLRVRVGLPLDADQAGATSTFDTILTAIAD